jgi:hypothetical protein
MALVARGPDLAGIIEFVIPAQAGTHGPIARAADQSVLAFAGTTNILYVRFLKFGKTDLA